LTTKDLSFTITTENFLGCSGKSEVWDFVRSLAVEPGTGFKDLLQLSLEQFRTTVAQGMPHLDFLSLLLESRRSSPSSYSASCGTYGIARGVYPENASQEDSTPDLYLIKVAVMAPTTARTVKNTRKPYPPTTISNRLWFKQGQI
jgi:hypothetical protein